MRRTAKGEMVDFDLIKAKQQMAAKPPPKEVSVRQSIIDRRLRKKASAMTPSPINQTPVEPTVIEKEVVIEEPAQVIDTTSDLDDMPPEKEEKPKAPRRRQKTKPKQSSGDEDATDTSTT